MIDSRLPRLTPPITARDHAQGPAEAPATLVMFGDYECPYTRRAHQTVRQVRRQLGDAFRFVFRNFPLVEIHPHALHAVLAAEAADTQGRFWEMHDHLFAHQRALEDGDLLRYAGELGLDAARLAQDVGAHVHAARIDEDVASGERSGVEGTPTLFVNGLPRVGLRRGNAARGADRGRHRRPRPVRLNPCQVPSPLGTGSRRRGEMMVNAGRRRASSGCDTVHSTREPPRGTAPLAPGAAGSTSAFRGVAGGVGERPAG